jgi:hypothetical protein
MRKHLKLAECGGYVFVRPLMFIYNKFLHRLTRILYDQRLKLHYIAHLKVIFRDAHRMSKTIGTAYRQTSTHTGTNRMVFNRRFKPTGSSSPKNIICIHTSYSTQKCYLLNGIMRNNSILWLWKKSFQARG